jgi:hypothetical protein
MIVQRCWTHAGTADRTSSTPESGSGWTREAFSRSNKPFSDLGDILFIGAIWGAENPGDCGTSGKSRITNDGFILSIQSDGSAAVVANRMSGPDGNSVSLAVAKWMPVEPLVTEDDTGVVF